MKKNFIVKITLSLFLLFNLVTNGFEQTEEPILKIHYLGHSSFVMQFDNGVSVVTDFGNYNAWGMGSYIHDFGGLVPTIMSYSHTHHADHYDASRIPDGVQHILTELDSLEMDGLTITPIRVCENNLDNEDNSAFLFEYKGFRILHLGDAQVQIINIEDPTVKEHIRNIIPDSLDLLFMTIEGQSQFIPQAELFVDLVKPKAIIPMHHWSEAYLSDFLSHLESQNGTGKHYEIVDSSSSKYNISADDSPEPVKVISLIRSPFIYTEKDFDGNVYETIKIGSQIWLKENLKSLHYSDGTEIPGVVAYDNLEENAEIYGRLYSWNSAMKNSTQESVQGVCPYGWHIPSDNEWFELENYLGGANVAGGKMKEASLDYWTAPNTNADNSSGFTALPGGEYDAYYTPNKFWLKNTSAVFWTSTETNDNAAMERYLSYNDGVSGRLAWQKVMKYSIRCVKNRLSYGFSFNKNKGNLPLDVQFTDDSDPSLFIHSWEWDFENDGTVDSYEQNPSWTYTEPGVYKVTATFISDTQTKSITHEDSIIVFNGESSLKFSEANSVIKVAPNEKLNLNERWTIEAWIKPTNLYGKYIFDKNSLSISTNKSSGGLNKNSLVLKFTQDDGSLISISSEDSSLTLDKWQNIAITYNYPNKVLEFYIDGIKQELNADINLVFDSPIKTNLEDTLYIANRKTIPRSFDGNIDEVRVWSTDLTKEELDINRYKYLNGNENDLIAYWKLNEGSGEIILDNSINENNGKIILAEYDWGIDYSTLVYVEDHTDDSSIPKRFSLYQNYPNPFNPGTTIKYSIPDQGLVTLNIYDILGSHVASLVNNEQLQGNHEVDFDGSKLSSGIYFYTLKVNNFIQSKKMLLIK